MLSLARLLIEMDSSPLMDSGEESGADRCVRNGLSVDENLWANFMKICGDAPGLADLLDVPEESVSQWSSKIKSHLDRVQKHDAGASTKTEMIPTGS